MSSVVYSSILIVLTLVFSPNVNANELKPRNCISPDVEPYKNFNSESVKLLGEVSLHDFVEVYTDLDAKARSGIKNLSFQKLNKVEALKEKLYQLLDLNFISQAICMVNFYEEGDIVHLFEIKSETSYSKGYALKRGSNFVAYSYIEDIHWD